MKVLVIGTLIGFGVILTLICFSLATFFGAQRKRMLDPRSPEDSMKRAEGTAVTQNMKARAGVH